MGMEGSHGKDPTHGNTKLKKARVDITFRTEALRWAMQSMLQHSSCQSFEIDRRDLIAMIKDLQSWPNFSTQMEIFFFEQQTEVIQTLQICFPDFKISYIPRAQNDIADSLAGTA